MRYYSLLMTIIVPLIIICPSVKADIAPWDRISHSVEGFFIKDDNITMTSFSVIVNIDLPDVMEEYYYVLKNNANKSIELETIIPIVFERSRSEYYEPDEIQLFQNGELYHNYSKRELEFYDVFLDDKELIRDMDHYTGIIINLSFNPYQEIEIIMLAHSTHVSYTESFYYFYTAKTAQFWNGSIQYNYFEMNYLSEMKSINYSVPNGTLNGTKLTSIMYNWDGNADYEVTVDTGIRYHHNKVPLMINLIVIGVIGITISIIVFISTKKMKKKGKKGLWIGKSRLI